MEVKIRDMSDEQLIELFKGLYEAIYVAECYGAADLVLIEAVAEELERRGYKIVERSEVEVVKVSE